VEVSALKVPRVTFVPIENLSTGLQRLRLGHRPERPGRKTLGELPLRVTPGAGDAFEVIDGFKRLERWQGEGVDRVPVVVEKPRSVAEEKAALLRANSPSRTLTPMDEARVVWSLRHEDKLGPKTIAGLCGKKSGWVNCRLTLAEKLCESMAGRVDAGTVGVGLAHALCALEPEEQEAVCASAEKNRLKGQEALALVSAYRAAESERERERLLCEPLATVRPQNRSVSPLGALGTRLEERLDRVSEALDEIATFRMPDEGLPPAERRRLEAKHRSVLHQLFETAREVGLEHPGLERKEEHGPRNEEPKTRDTSGATKATGVGETKEERPADQGTARGDRQAPQAEVRHPQDRPQGGHEPQGGKGLSGGTWLSQKATTEVDNRGGCAGEQAGPLSPADPGEGEEATDGLSDPAGDQVAGLHRRPHDPGRLRAHHTHAAGAEEEGVEKVRNPPR